MSYSWNSGLGKKSYFTHSWCRSHKLHTSLLVGALSDSYSIVAAAMTVKRETLCHLFSFHICKESKVNVSGSVVIVVNAVMNDTLFCSVDPALC